MSSPSSSPLSQVDVIVEEEEEEEEEQVHISFDLTEGEADMTTAAAVDDSNENIQNPTTNKNVPHHEASDEKAKRVVTLTKSVDQDSWIGTQIKAFTAWMNIHLSKRGIKVDDVITGVSTGVNLCHLMEELAGKKTHIPPMKKAKFLIHKLQNASIAIEFIEQQGITLVGIGSEDVVNGNVKIILGLIWTLIMNYQIQKATAAGARRIKEHGRVLQLSEEEEEREEEELTKFEPGLQTEHRRVSSTSLSATSGHDLDLPESPVPEDENLDQDTQSLSDEVKSDDEFVGDGSAKSELLSWVNHMLKPFQIKVANFTSGWQSGAALSKLVQSLDDTHTIEFDSEDPLELNRQAIDIAQNEFKIPKLIDADDVTLRPEELSLTLYISYFKEVSDELLTMRMKEKEEKITKDQKQDINESQTLDTEQCVLEGLSSDECNTVESGDALSFTLIGITSDGSTLTDGEEDLFHVEIVSDGESSAHQEIPTAICKDADGVYTVTLTPEKSGSYSIYVLADGKPILSGRKWKMHVKQHVSHEQSEVECESINRLRRMNIDSTSVVTIAAKDKHGQSVIPLEPGNALFEVTVTPLSTGVAESLELQWISEKGLVTTTFVARDEDTYQFRATLDGETVSNGEFVSNVFLTSEPICCEASGSGSDSDCLAANNETHFVVQAKNMKHENMQEGGDSVDIVIECVTSDDSQTVEDVTESYAVNVTDNADGTYGVAYTPVHPGIHIISAMVNGEHIANSPFYVAVRQSCEPSKCTAHGSGVFVDISAALTCDKLAQFVIQSKDTEGSDIAFGGEKFDISITITGDDGETQTLDCVYKDNQDGSYHVEYTPTIPGDIEIQVSLCGVLICNSPFHGQVKTWCDPQGTTIHGDGIRVAHTGHPTTFDIITFDKFEKRIEKGGAVVTVQVTDPDGNHIRSYLADQGDGSYRCHYMPSATVGPYTVEAKLDGVHINGSPFTVDVSSAVFAHKTWADGPGLEGADISSGENIPAVFTIYARDISNNPVLANVDEETTTKLKHLVHRLMTYQDRPKDLRMLNDTRLSEGDNQSTSEKHVSSDEIPSAANTVVRYYFDEIFYVSEEELVEFNNPLYEEVDQEALERGSKNFPILLDITNAVTSSSIEPLVLYTGNGEWTCMYTPTSADDHMVSMLTNDTEEEVKGSPFFVPVSEGIDPFHTEILRQGVQKAYEGFTASFLIQPKDKHERLIRTGGETFTISCTDVDSNPCYGMTMLDDMGNGTYRVYYVPTETGYFHVRVSYKGVEIKGSPVKCLVRAYDDAPYPPGCQVFGMKKRVIAGNEAKFLVSLMDAHGKELKAGKDDVDVQILSNGSAMIPASVTDHSTGRYTVSYTPLEKADLWIDVTVGGQPIAGSPFRVKVFSSIAEDRLQITSWGCVVEAPTSSVDLLDVSIDAPSQRNDDQYDEDGEKEEEDTFSPPRRTIIRPDVEGSDGLFEIHYELDKSNSNMSHETLEPYIIGLRLNGGEQYTFTQFV